MKLITFLLTFFVLGCSNSKSTELASINTSIVQTKSSDDPALGSHILKTMAIVHAKLTPVKRQILAQELITIANNMFLTLEQKKAWITVIAIESKFDPEAVSSSQATGLGQIMPQFFVKMGRICSINNLEPEDIRDPIINATVSACFFRYLLESVPDGSTTLALVAYNSGLYSDSTKNIQRLTDVNTESANYVTRFNFVKEKVEASVKKEAKETKKYVKRESED